jgi:sister-chromatid-cohesion protein PDS5
LNDDHSAIVEIFSALLNRSCPTIINRSNVPQLLILSKESTGRRRVVSTQRAIIAQDLLKEVSTTYPTMYHTYMKDILNDIMEDNDSTAADESLELLSEISKASNGKMNYKKDVQERLMSYVANGSVTQAAFAATALGNMKNADIVFADLASNLSDELLLNATNLLTNLTSLTQFALYTSEVITPTIDSIIRFIESDLLPASTTQVSKRYTEMIICIY